MLNKFASIALYALFNGAQSTKAAYVDYTTNNGADWPDKYPDCAGPN